MVSVEVERNHERWGVRYLPQGVKKQATAADRLPWGYLVSFNN
jgi:hypothetical protein